MAIAKWNGAVLAESDECQIVDGNHYFPPQSIKQAYFRPSDTRSTCPWKGEASYYTIEVAGQTNQDAAWYYPKTLAAAKNIEEYVAFWKGISVEA